MDVRYWIVCNHFRICETQGVIIELKDVFVLTFKGGTVRQVVNEWNATMNLLQNVPSDEVLECVFRAQLEKSVQLKEMLALIDQDMVRRGQKKSYQTLMHAVQAHLEHRHMTKMRDDLDNTHTGAVGGKARGKGGGKRSQSAQPTKGDCNQFLNGGRCPKGSNCEFQHDYVNSNNLYKPAEMPSNHLVTTPIDVRNHLLPTIQIPGGQEEAKEMEKEVAKEVAQIETIMMVL